MKGRPTLAGGGSVAKVVETEDHKQVTMIIVGAGQRGQTYARYALEHPTLSKVVGVAEPRPHRRNLMKKTYNLPDDMVVADWEELLAKGRVADAVVIGTLDQMHAPQVAAFSKLGYDILCEKPMAVSIADCVKMTKEVKDAGSIFGVGHVLRYSPFNQAVKKIIDSGALGDIVNIQHIEPVGDEHFAHSFVRGNWHKESDTSFALMTKCCHDIDIVSFYLSGLVPKRVSSFGSLFQFNKAKKPKEAGNARRCLDCAYEPKCTWSAKKIYLQPLTTDDQHWAKLFVDADVLDIENVTDALNKTNYGSCVYETDNDVVDHQVVNVEYDGGVTANITMSAFTEAECERSTRIHGTKGELIGDMTSFTVFDFLTRTKTVHNPPLQGGYHGGGDIGLSKAFVEAVARKDQSKLGVTPDEVLNSHLLVFAGETARKQGTVVNFEEFKKEALASKA
ncbi:putative NAD-binding Rossmann fold oxidoreductase [Kockovaella imperatae]|uniref:Putative NAD-binding Rossmann fold oxidoreductase n=1 Tax=Kockovaella imperatae TaxID=4999 RepID=A0A1Y1UH68_9TREE|nr:putative NAD-binding Rossmann fold oxidoreductase [Kockovaella imperatae]ORX37400.1 putative NAD-binding Rossmann fold oxidoreductase [Kockovaella imperatae]